jgi:hypothetical protein
MHPSLIYKTKSDIGFEDHKKSVLWFEIPLQDVMSQSSLIFRNTRLWQNSKTLVDSDFEAVAPDRVAALSGMPDINSQYYLECFKKGEKPLLWKRAPHILLKSRLNIEKYRVFDWQD